MTKLSGMVHKSDLEGGFWELVCDDGRSFVLHGGDAQLRTQGLRVEVEGRIDEDAMGIAMAGPIVEVKRYRVLR
jgi:hypothetical protein